MVGEELQSLLQTKLETAAEACSHPIGGQPWTDDSVTNEGDEAAHGHGSHDLGQLL